MERLRAVAGSLVFLLLAPGCVAGGIPWLITGWQVEQPWAGAVALRIVGALWAAAALAVLLESFARFAWQGLGTPAPVLPTRTLVATGWYRHVRNPMYVAVVSLVLAQGLIFCSAGLLVYGVALWGVFHAFVLAYEEPTLRRAHGAAYDDLCAHVPRWLPRLRAWRPDIPPPTSG